MAACLTLPLLISKPKQLLSPTSQHTQSICRRGLLTRAWLGLQHKGCPRLLPSEWSGVSALLSSVREDPQWVVWFPYSAQKRYFLTSASPPWNQSPKITALRHSVTSRFQSASVDTDCNETLKSTVIRWSAPECGRYSPHNMALSSYKQTLLRNLSLFALEREKAAAICLVNSFPRLPFWCVLIHI